MRPGGASTSARNFSAASSSMPLTSNVPSTPSTLVALNAPTSRVLQFTPPHGVSTANASRAPSTVKREPAMSAAPKP